MPESVGRYRILDRIGSGALGELYRARDTRFGRTVALRIVCAGIAEDGDRRQRLIDGARAAEALSHPNIAALYEIGDDAGLLYLAGEFVPGRTLTLEQAGMPLNRRRALELGAQMADALAEAHAAGIVHGRLAADRVIVTPKGTAKVLGFGLDACPHAAGVEADERADVCALGRVLCEMLTGRPHAARPRAGLEPAGLDALVNRMLAADDEGPSPAIVAAELRSLIPNP